jgi:GWxTD domain-containing protein
MRNRSSLFAILMALAVLPPGLVAAQKLDKDDKKWLDDVRPIMLGEEEKTYKGLKEKGARTEFQLIFWARRDPDLATPENEFQAEYLAARATADQKYRVPGQVGSTTDCGRTFILLGKPDEVRDEGSGSPGLLDPQTWTYRDRPGQTFQGGKAVIAFDAECRAPAGFTEQLDRIAAAKVLQPNIDYRVGKDGRLVKLADLLPRDTAARALFKQPRQDFATALQVAFLKVADGGTALIGLMRGEAGALATGQSGAAKTVNVSVAASAVAEDGKEAGWTEQTLTLPVGADGSFLASFKLGLKAGKYTLKAGAVDVKGGKASLAVLPVEVPDFSKMETAPDGTSVKVATVGSIFVVRGIEEMAAPDPLHPFAAFELGKVRMIPVFGGVVHKAEQVEFFYQIYDLRLNPLTGKSEATALLSILKDGKTPVAKAPPNQIETEVTGSSVGPLALAAYEPGKYVVQLKVTDRLAKKELVQEAPLEILP